MACETVKLKASAGFVLRGKPVEPGRCIWATMEEAEPFLEDGRAEIVDRRPEPVSHRDPVKIVDRDPFIEPPLPPQPPNPFKEETQQGVSEL